MCPCTSDQFEFIDVGSTKYTTISGLYTNLYLEVTWGVWVPQYFMVEGFQFWAQHELVMSDTNGANSLEGEALQFALVQIEEECIEHQASCVLLSDT